MRRRVLILLTAVLLAACQAGPAPEAMLREESLESSLAAAQGSVSAAEAVGVPGASYVCVLGEADGPSQAIDEIRTKLKGKPAASHFPHVRGPMIYVVAPSGEKLMPLSRLKVLADDVGVCQGAGSVFNFDSSHSAWKLEPALDPNRGSPAGKALVARLQEEEDVELPLMRLLDDSDLLYVCLGSQAPNDFVETINAVYRGNLPPSGLKRPNLKWQEAVLYLRSATRERVMTVPLRGGLSAAGEICAPAGKAVFHKRDDEWRLERRP